jgi:hypothetical protein
VISWRIKQLYYSFMFIFFLFDKPLKFIGKNIWKSSLKLLGKTDCLHWIWAVLKRYDSFSFYLSIAVLLVILYLIAANESVLLLYISNVNNLFCQEAWGRIFKCTGDDIVEKTMKIELSPIPQAYTLKCDNVNLTYEQNCIIFKYARTNCHGNMLLTMPGV